MPPTPNSIQSWSSMVRASFIIARTAQMVDGRIAFGQTHLFVGRGEVEALEDMPELKWAYGYYLVIGVVIAIRTTLYVQFRRNGWLDLMHQRVVRSASSDAAINLP